MSNEYCVGVVGLRNGSIIQNPIIHDEIVYELLVKVNPKRFLLDVKATPEFILKSIDKNTRLGLFFRPWLNEKCWKRGSMSPKYRIIEQFFDVPDPMSDVESSVASTSASVNLTPSPFDLYSMLHDAHEQGPKTNEKVNLPVSFLPTLRPYQSNALQWMLHRERVNSYQVQEFVPVTCNSIANKMFYFNHRTNELLDKVPQLLMSTGGILADEMGLGKTVEVLALILSNPRLKRKLSEDHDEPANLSNSVQKRIRCLCRDPSIGFVIKCPKCSYWQHKKCVAKYTDQPILNYICPECWKLEPPVESSATFIACPSSIKYQWSNEIRKHIANSNLKIFDYDGMKRSGWICPSFLAKYDIVLCDYATMSTEIHYSGESREYNMRSRKLIIAVPESPLTKIRWWRVVLDEAQMVEAPSRQCSQMVKSLPSVHRWAVTGTPIEKSIDDLHGLMVFLDYEPYSDRGVWNKLTDAFKKGDAQPLIHQCLKNIMWRTSKINVSAELGIPEQQVIVHNVKMDELEAKFYSDQHLNCESEFHKTVDMLTRSSKGSLKMNARTLKLIMEPLRKLRRDCTVPTIIEEKDERLPVHKILKSPAELFEHMVKENEHTCILALKWIALCSNDLAETHLKDNTASIEMYKHVLTVVKDCTDFRFVNIKSLPPLKMLRNLLEFTKPLLKSLRNLLELTKSPNKNAVETQAECLNEIEQLEWPHIIRINDSLKEIREKQINLEKEITVHTDEAHGNTIHWWNDVFNITDKNIEELIVTDVNQILTSVKHRVCKVTSFDDIRVLLNSWLHSIETERGNVKNVFKEHDFFVTRLKAPILLSEETLNRIDEHDADDPSGNNVKAPAHGSLCLLCHKYKVRDVLKNYKSLLIENERSRSCEEKILRAILNIILNKSLVDSIDVSQMEFNANEYFEVLLLLKKEVKEYDNYLLKIDEGTHLSNVLRRTPQTDDIELKTEWELRAKTRKADEIFSKSFQILKYVKLLENSKQLDAYCPICYETPTISECVLQCGHKMCRNCFKRIKKNHPVTYSCHMCRNTQYIDHTYQVFINVSIIGDYSKKIQEIVQTALNLSSADPDVKILIFSHWNDILQVIHAALFENGVQSCTKSSKIDECIEKFKNKDQKVTCLLLPLAFGSKGLNLIEATHVFLVEPILDPTEELQAIGRIHRIGQTKPTFVHRFIMLKTIEETIFTTVSKDMSEKWKTTNVTVENLKEFFVQYRQIN